MKNLIILVNILSCTVPCFSQNCVKTSTSIIKKAIIDSAAINHWVSLGRERAISNDGNYFMYNLSNQPIGSSTLIVQSIKGAWKRSFAGAASGLFSKDSKQLIFALADTLFCVVLGTELLHKKLNIRSYKLSELGSDNWLAYQLKDPSNELVLCNLFSGTEQRFSGVTDYLFSNDGNSMLIKNISINDDNFITTLQLINMQSGRITRINSVENNFIADGDIVNYIMDATGKQVAFIKQKKIKDQFINTIWYYHEGMNGAVKQVDNQCFGIPVGLTIARSELKFSDDGRYIFFQLQEPERNKSTVNEIGLDVWSYSDTLLQGTQLYQIDAKIYEASIGIKSDTVIRLTYDYEGVKIMPVKGDFAVINGNNAGDRFWLHQKDSNWLISLKDGSRRSLPTEEAIDFLYSPDGNYLVYYAFNKVGAYFSMNLTTGKVLKISNFIQTSLNVKDAFFKDITISSEVGMAGWQKNGGLLVYDNYDIWQLDPTGKNQAINITQGYGRIHHVKFRLLAGIDGASDCLDKEHKKCMLLTAFNTINKYNGLYELELNRRSAPQLLTMGPWTIDHQGPSVLPVNSNELNEDMVPIKALDTNSWILLRHTAEEAPNYFMTRDFKNYRALTDLQPQVNYNWLRTELINWIQLDGTISQGVLYKPEDFDSHKRYPILFIYYEQLSHRVYEYPIPDYTRNSINIPWFVSRGYLVFTPDIYYTKGKPGASTYNTVESAALFLSKMPYVDARHMGINGHSSGGFETNYLVSHSHFFAAAVEGAGTSDWVSSSLELSGVQGTARGSRLGGYEQLMGATLWQRPDLYRENSPVLLADKVTTPLLIYHSKDDTAVPWEQGVELFIALRRLGKKVWMLQYDDQNHGNDGKAAEDFTIRITQFFDHYLQEMPSPRWMTRGIPARLKGLEAGYELDSTDSNDKNNKASQK